MKHLIITALCWCLAIAAVISTRLLLPALKLTWLIVLRQLELQHQTESTTLGKAPAKKHMPRGKHSQASTTATASVKPKATRKHTTTARPTSKRTSSAHLATTNATKCD